MPALPCQEVTHDYHKAFIAAGKCACEFDWDAVVANMVYVWTGLAHSLGLRYYAVPGVDIGPDVGFQYIEPGEDNAFMKADEYDQLIDDPTAFLYSVWLPRVARDVDAVGSPSTYRSHVALVKSGMAMLQYFSDSGPQVEALRSECGTVSRDCGDTQGTVRYSRGQAAGVHRADDGYDRTAGESAGRLRGADAASVPRGRLVCRPELSGSHRLLDAPGLRAVRFKGAVRVALLAQR